MVTPAIDEGPVIQDAGSVDSGAEWDALLNDAADVTGEPETPESVSEVDAEPTEPAGPAAPAPLQVPQDEVAKLRADNARLMREAEQRQREASEARLQQAASQYAQDRLQSYVQQGYDETVARQIAVLEAREQVQLYKAQQAELRAARIDISHRYGVPMEHLHGFQDEASMRHYAEQYANVVGPGAKRVQELEARLAALEKGRVPAQQYNNAAGSAGGAPSPATLVQRYANGEIPWSPRIQKILDS